MLLTIDIGNSNTLLGLYDGRALLNHWRIRTDILRMPDEYGIVIVGLFEQANFDPSHVDAICMSSVVPRLTKIFIRACERYFDINPFLVDASVKMNIEIKIEHPTMIGADRLANAVAARCLHNGAVCIIDLGTATTFDVVTHKGYFIGGAIAPGIGISANALFSKAAKLPHVEFVCPPSPIGSNTIHAVQSGLLYGYIGLIEGIITRFRAELEDDMKVIATGGLARNFSEHISMIDDVNPWLTSEGLRFIWDMNHKEQD